MAFIPEADGPAWAIECRKCRSEFETARAAGTCPDCGEPFGNLPDREGP